MPTFWNLLDWPEITAAGLDSLAMLGGALCFILLLGLPLGIVLHLFARRQLLASARAYALLSFVVNIVRSVPAQKLLFAHTNAGDLTALFAGFFDTEVGGKREAGSYRAIADRLGTSPGEILFLSDVVAELDAARDAGLRTVLLDRREDYPQPRTGAGANGHMRVESFADIAVAA